MDNCSLTKSFNDFTTECRELFLDAHVPVLQHPPSPLVFLREWVNANKPVVIRHATRHWSALTKWTPEYLRVALEAVTVTVAVTPTGYADAVCDGQFVLPEERHMHVPEFLDHLDGGDPSRGVFYIQKQNSNFTDEFDVLIKDAENEIPWATEAFGRVPDAVNFWLGDGRAVTSLHKDHYENLYCVVRGAKTFTLLPPSDQPFVRYDNYPVAQYKEREPGQWDVIPLDDHSTVPWISVDPLRPDLTRFPEFAHARPLQVTVKAGDLLYLPSLWYHHVTQSHGCIAVNFWYDMEYDLKYAYYKLVEDLCSKMKKRGQTRDRAADSRGSAADNRDDALEKCGNALSNRDNIVENRDNIAENCDNALESCGDVLGNRDNVTETCDNALEHRDDITECRANALYTRDNTVDCRNTAVVDTPSAEDSSREQSQPGS